MRGWVVLSLGLIASFLFLTVVINYMRSTGPAAREEDGIYFVREKEFMPDTYYCFYGFVEKEGKLSVWLRTVDYRGIDRPYYIIFIIRLPEKITVCKPPAEYYQVGGEEVLAREGWGEVAASATVSPGHYIVVMAQTNNLVGLTKVRINMFTS